MGEPQTFTANIDGLSVSDPAWFDDSVDWNGSAWAVTGSVLVHSSTHIFDSAGPTNHLVATHCMRIDHATDKIDHRCRLHAVSHGVNLDLFDLVWSGTNQGDKVRLTQIDETTVEIEETQLGGVAGATQTVLEASRVAVARSRKGTTISALADMHATPDGGTGGEYLYGGQGGDILIGVKRWRRTSRPRDDPAWQWR